MIEPDEFSNEGEAPCFTVVSGNPTPSDIAAVTVVLGAMAQELDGGQSAAAPVRSAWAHSQRPIRTPVFAGPGAWNRNFA